MQIGKVINLKDFNKFFLFFRENRIIIFLLSIFIFGFGFGIFSCNRFEEFKTFSKECLDNFIFIRSDLDFLKIAVNSFFSSFTYIVLIFVFGASITGVAILPFIILYNGFTYGALISILYNEYALKGIAFNAVMVLPSAAIFVTAIILASRESFCFSLKIAHLTLPKTNPANLFYDFKNYCGRYLIICLIVIFSALLDAFVSCNFSVNFSL